MFNILDVFIMTQHKSNLLYNFFLSLIFKNFLCYIRTSQVLYYRLIVIKPDVLTVYHFFNFLVFNELFPLENYSVKPL